MQFLSSVSCIFRTVITYLREGGCCQWIPVLKVDFTEMRVQIKCVKEGLIFREILADFLL
jgi:hypothetical protein